jgi:hypothetical protein
MYLNNYLPTVNQLHGAYLIVFLSTTALPLREPASAEISRDSCLFRDTIKETISVVMNILTDM